MPTAAVTPDLAGDGRWLVRGSNARMAVNLETRSIESAVATEVYISAMPGENAPAGDQAREIFSGIRDTLRSTGARILQERIFLAKGAADVAAQARVGAYGDIDDGVAPSVLFCDQGSIGPVAGVQVHAICSDNGLEIVSAAGSPCGRLFRGSGRTYLTLSGISAPGFSEATEQAKAMMSKAESALKQFGVGFLSVPRTWMWLCDILSWYDDFNRVRNAFFSERGLIGEGTRQSMPASTGIGLCYADGCSCAMDLAAVLEPKDSTQYLEAIGKQQCALEYGSAFSRASQTTTPAGRTVFVSGTASIDAEGATTNIGDALGQINTTIDNVRAVLSDMHVGDDDVVQVVAYCKTPEVERIFNGVKTALRWPWVTVLCDICRPELLFEIEAAALTPIKSK